MNHTIYRILIISAFIFLVSISNAWAQEECGGSNKNCPPKSAPPLGNYACNITRWDVAQKRIVFDYQGYFTLKAGGVYQWLDNGGTGKYSYDARTFQIKWASGHLADLGGVTEFGLDGETPEITITINTESGELIWQCALEE